MRNKAILIVLSLGAIIVTASSFGFSEKKQKRNLKVLPMDISEKALDSLMETYSKALGVDCKFCHIPTKFDPEKLDFASDAKPEKEITRKMMIMTNDINRKYFNFNEKEHDESLQAVNCQTCHRGEPHPSIE